MRCIKYLLYLTLLLALPASADEKPKAPLFGNLGSFQFPVSTHNPLAQRFFNQGMILFYGFEWGESIRSFREAARLDPQCGMCYWGVALALGAKINAPISGHEYKDAKQAIETALALKNNETTREQAYIQALARRYQHKPKNLALKTGTFSCHISSATFDVSSKTEIADYAHAMEKVAAAFPNDNDAKALASFALFDTVNWQFWDKNGKINRITPKLMTTLQSILQQDKNHIGGNHYYIHVMEESPTPEVALTSAARLKTLVAGSEHLVHMPTHIYFLTGRYHEGTDANQQAVNTFKQYNMNCKIFGFAPEINYLYFHNYDFLRTTASMEGRKQLALDAAHEMLNPPFPAWLRNDSSLQWFIPIPYFVAARFGMWQELLKEPKPDNQYQYAQGMWHYARGLALVRTGNVKAAARAATELNKIIVKGANDAVLQANGIQLLKLADAILNASLAASYNNKTLTFAYLKTADRIQYDMGYHEPPDWYFPVKEMLGAAYLHWNQPKQAAQMYSQVLKQYPKDGWALLGLFKSLKLQGKKQEAQHILDEYQDAWRFSDVPEAVPLM